MLLKMYSLGLQVSGGNALQSETTMQLSGFQNKIFKFVVCLILVSLSRHLEQLLFVAVVVCEEYISINLHSCRLQKDET